MVPLPRLLQSVIVKEVTAGGKGQSAENGIKPRLQASFPMPSFGGLVSLSGPQKNGEVTQVRLTRGLAQLPWLQSQEGRGAGREEMLFS